MAADKGRIKKMKIALVYPPTTVYTGDPSAGGLIVPMGLVYIGAVCEKAGYEVKVFDFSANDNIEVGDGWKYYGVPKEEIRRQLAEYKPDIVGIQCMYSAYAQDAYDCAKIAKSVGSLVVIGGVHPSVCYNEITSPDIDLVVVGEGEETFLEIIKRYRNNEDLTTIIGTKGNPPRPLIKDLDTLPFPALHLLPIKQYIHRYSKVSFNWNMHPSMFIISSRGCPYHCSFCSVKSVWGRTWRGHSPKRVVDEIERLIKDYGVREVQFQDDNASADVERLKAICDELIRRKVKIRWTNPGGFAIWLVDDECLRKMKKSGCYRITFSIETAVGATRKYIKKTQIDLKEANRVIKYANKLGMWTVSNFIIGFPDETEKEIKETIDFVVKSDLDFAFFLLPMLFPHTEMTEDYKRRGLFVEGGKYLSGRYGVATKHFTSEQLNEIQRSAYARLIRNRLFRFMKAIGKVRSWEDLCFFWKLFTHGVNHVWKKYVVMPLRRG